MASLAGIFLSVPTRGVVRPWGEAEGYANREGYEEVGRA